MSDAQSSWIFERTRQTNATAIRDAQRRQDSLTKPPGSLGLLEEIGMAFSGWQGTDKPSLEAIQITVFAGDHGIATKGVSAFPQSVTLEMIRNFSRGGAAISVLARQLEASFSVVNLGTVQPCEKLPGVKNMQLAPGTQNFVEQAAMSEDLCIAAMATGKQQLSKPMHLFVGGEMGIGNTSAACALVCALTGAHAEEFVGTGTGLQEEGVRQKRKLIQQALDKHGPMQDSPLACLCYFGGLEIAALAGSYIACAQQGIPVLVDGFISSAAAFAACRINEGCRDWLIFSHCSAEQGHQKLLQLLDAEPLINFNMRLGEGSGAALVVPLLQSACRLQSEMSTFAEAGVSSS